MCHTQSMDDSNTATYSSNSPVESINSNAASSVQAQDTPAQQAPQAKNPSEKPDPGTGKTVATILTLIFFWPVGLIFMFLWMKWPVWLKVVITILLVISLPFVFIFFAAALIAINPKEAQDRARDSYRMQAGIKIQSILNEYYQDNGDYPESLFELSTTGYLPQVPSDPSGGPIEYQVDSSGQDFMLCWQEYESEANSDIPLCLNSIGPIQKQ